MHNCLSLNHTLPQVCLQGLSPKLQLSTLNNVHGWSACAYIYIYTALLLPISKSECLFNGQPDLSILLILSELTFCSRNRCGWHERHAKTTIKLSMEKSEFSAGNSLSWRTNFNARSSSAILITLLHFILGFYFDLLVSTFTTL